MANRNLRAEADRNIKDYFAPIYAYFQDESVNEIMINAAGKVFIESGSSMAQLDVVLSEHMIEAGIRAIMTTNSKSSKYIMDARMDGLRIAATLAPVAVHGAMLSIRKHATRRISLEDYEQRGGFNVLDETSARASGADQHSSTVAAMEHSAQQGGAGLTAFLKWAVQAHKTIMVVGGTGSGKTTLITSLLENIANTERIITCEDTNEIKLYQPNIVQLEAQSDEGITIRDLIKHCLRLRPDRIIVGEVRGPEAYDMVDSMNTGHPGALFTLHANSAFEGLGRLETLMGMNPNCAGASQASVRKQIASAVDYVIFASRRAGVRGPEQIIALDGTTLAHEYKTRIIFDRLQYARGEGEIASPSPS